MKERQTSECMSETRADERVDLTVRMGESIVVPTWGIYLSVALTYPSRAKKDRKPIALGHYLAYVRTLAERLQQRQQGRSVMADSTRLVVNIFLD